MVPVERNKNKEKKRSDSTLRHSAFEHVRASKIRERTTTTNSTASPGHKKKERE